MPKPLTVELLHKEASSFAKAQSKHAEPSLFGVTDGKAIGTYLEHKFQRMAYVTKYPEQREAFEVQVRFNTGAKIEATFPKRAEAIAFLRSFA